MKTNETKYQKVATLKGQGLSTKEACKKAGVQTGAYYVWKRKTPSTQDSTFTLGYQTVSPNFAALATKYREAADLLIRVQRLMS